MGHCVGGCVPCAWSQRSGSSILVTDAVSTKTKASLKERFPGYDTSAAKRYSMDLVMESVKLASQLHSRQRKKKPIVLDIPYLGYLMEVAGIVQSNGGDETTAAAALLHDAIEDQGAEAREHIRAQLGQAVLEIVEACTESETFPKPSWRERKAAYLKQVEAASVAALLVMVADKLQNSRALLRRLTLQAQRGGGVPAARKSCGISNA